MKPPNFLVKGTIFQTKRLDCLLLCAAWRRVGGARLARWGVTLSFQAASLLS